MNYLFFTMASPTQPNNNTQDELTDIQAVIPAATTTSRNSTKRAHIWVKLYKKEGNKFVFLENTNKRDLCLFREISVSLPFEAGFGTITSLWKDVAERISNVQEGVGELLFGEAGVSGKACVDRFKTMMEWCGKYQQDQPFLSGCDDQEAPSELLTLIEEMHERWQ